MPAQADVEVDQEEERAPERSSSEEEGEVALRELAVLLFDVQATDASPERGQIIDVAWCVGSIAGGFSECFSSLVALEEGARLSRRVRELTGISAAMLAGAPTLEEVRAALAHALDREGGAPIPIPVAHYARYETPFFDDLLRSQPHLSVAPFVCTHQIARRLMPGLPRRGLRAIAGYFGAHLPEHKRSEVHVEATRVIWQEVVELLAEEEGVSTLGDLRAWLERPAPKGVARTFPLPRERRLGLPETPGVYRMLGRQGEVLYVGKATSLKQRVNSYFRGKRGEGERKLEMAAQIWELDVTPLDSPLEAALLEADEIKRHEPPYNKVLRSRERQLYFLDGVLPWQMGAGYSSERFTLGPTSDAELFEAWRMLVASVRDGEPRCEILHGLDDPTIFSEGLAMWREARGVSAGEERPLEWWVALGEQLIDEANARRAARRAAKLAAKALAAAGEEEEGEDEEEEDEEREAWSWSPGAVRYGLDAVVRRAVRHLLRGELLQRLWEAELSWVPQRGPRAGERKVLRIARGEVCSDAARLGEEGEVAREGRCWTLPHLDRLRVLITELKRLCAEPRHEVVLRLLDTGEEFDQEALSSRLERV